MDVIKKCCDVLIIGGGTAGCNAAITIAKRSNASVIVVEKANMERSGCLAAGVNAINAYIVKGRTPEDYVEYAKWDAHGIVREDLLQTMAEGVNEATDQLASLGVVMLRDDNGDYVARGNRNIKINGENIKPVLANAVRQCENVKVMNYINMIDYVVHNNRIYGAIGFGIHKKEMYVFEAKAVICATGGASGIYRPNNPGFSRHKIWYSPFNTGAGYAMGIRAGAEMTTFEMRFIALRCKDTIAPTGTIAQGIHAKQINAFGEEYEKIYGNTTSDRVYGAVKENMEGRGPNYLKTKGITSEEEAELMKAYLNMAPGQTLLWKESNKSPKDYNVEIEGTEPYIVGGHTASGYWVDTNRQTTILGLYAAGDVAGGCPQKYVTGAMVEGKIAALASLEYIKNRKIEPLDKAIVERKRDELNFILERENSDFTTEDLEEAMQKVMDEYAGGIGANYQFNEHQLVIAEEKITHLLQLSSKLSAADMQELMYVYELKDRLLVALSVIAHLRARKETRWHCFGSYMDYPKTDDSKWLRYVNSKMVDGALKIIYRNLVKRGEIYEHKD